MPGILRANACPNLVLEGRVQKGFLGLSRKVVVHAVCSKYLVDVPEPHVGCGHCHEERPGIQLLRPGYMLPTTLSSSSSRSAMAHALILFIG